MGVGRTIGVLAGIAIACGMATAAHAPYLIALSAVEPGQWQLKEVDGAARSLCVADPRTLLQIQHGQAACSRFVVANEARIATVHYTCPGAGHGRTTISVQGGRLHLQTQGILDGAPFDTEYDGRRLGDCGGAGTGPSR